MLNLVGAGNAVPGKVSPEHSWSRRTTHKFRLRAAEGVTGIEFGNHIAGDQCQIVATGDERQLSLIFRLDRLPIHAVHVRVIEEVSRSTPAFVENLTPLRDRINGYGQAGQFESAGSRRNGSSGRINDLQPAGTTDKQLLSIPRKLNDLNIVRQGNHRSGNDTDIECLEGGV